MAERLRDQPSSGRRSSTLLSPLKVSHFLQSQGKLVLTKMAPRPRRWPTSLQSSFLFPFYLFVYTPPPRYLPLPSTTNHSQQPINTDLTIIRKTYSINSQSERR